MNDVRVFFRAAPEARVLISQERGSVVLFRSPRRRAGYFCFGKSSQNHCARHAGFGNVVLPKLPLVLADRAPARTRTSLCSD
ncbi:MAG TPA: hypothetical protein VFL63_04310, partial [Rhodanobacteraceae bacterium]|nr:hypothetical protein [Rhodanobacteraceae bacterium]